eukprot:jgi/Botrbrau1/4365/Bobra.105_2s0012.1
MSVPLGKATMKKPIGKGQRSLDSFFFKPPAKAGPSAKCTDTPVETSPDGLEPPNKKPRLEKRSTFFENTRDESSRSEISANGAMQVGYSTNGANPVADRPDTNGTKGISMHIPSQSSVRHQRFQKKLVENPAFGQRKQPGAEDIVPQKHTPLELQVLALKKKYPDCILIIEVGYKFRFFGEDAEIAARLCNIMAFPDRNFLSASCPVHRLPVYARRLVEAGYKVGVVRQVETAAMKKSGDNKYAPFERKLTAMYTRSTLEAGGMEDVGEAGAEPEEGGGPPTTERLSRYLVCVVEEEILDKPGEVLLGMVAVETSTGDVLYAEFTDGVMRSNLEARLMFSNPSELLVAAPLTGPSQRLLGSYTSSARGLRAETVSRGKYKDGGGLAAVVAFYGAQEGLPAVQAGAVEAVMALPKLVLQALAHALDYLKPFGFEAVLRLGANFRPFHTAHEMHLGPNALRQLEVLRNSFDGSEKGSLLWLMNHTLTPFGSRLLRNWVAHPLRDRDLINARLSAVEEIAFGSAGDSRGPVASLKLALRGLPDLERGITRIFHRTVSPGEFATIMRALSSVRPSLGIQAGDGEEELGISSPLLRDLLRDAASGDVARSAKDLLAMIDEPAAAANDKVALLTCEARFPKLFRARERLRDSEKALLGLLPQLRKQLGMPRLDYCTIQNQGSYMIEIPVERTDIPKDWEKVCGTKKMNRFRPPAVREAMDAMELAKEQLQATAGAAWDSFLQDFGVLYAPFRAAVQALATLDALLSLAALASTPGYVRPEFVGDEEEAQLVIEGGRHPMLEASAPDTAVVPNDVQLLQHSGPRAAVVTGPNMGGKSCYIREAALIVIMAQIGSFVPASKANMHVMDAVFTRMGASDNLALGRSTFLEELSETSDILERATARSLVIVDELGRGTSTHDGLAIALATLYHLVSSTRCLTLFVTHYPRVASLEKTFPGLVQAYHMAYLREGAAPSQDAALPNQDTDFLAESLPTTRSSVSPEGPLPLAPLSVEPPGGEAVPKITFLYKLAPGVADRSFGFNVARLAQLPPSVIDVAAHHAWALESSVLARIRSRRQDRGAEDTTESNAMAMCRSVGRVLETSQDAEACIQELRRLRSSLLMEPS